MYTQSSIDFDSLKISIVKDLFKHQVIKINTAELFTLSSGIKLPIYLDHRLIFSFPVLRKKIIDAWAFLIDKNFPKEQIFGNTNIVFSGTATAGIAPAYALCMHTDTGFVYVRGKSKEHGLKSQIEGYSNSDQKFIVIDDMVVTGSSLLKNAHVLREIYSVDNILCATSISCHESAKMRQTFEKNQLPYFSLFTTYEIFNIALNQSVIDLKTFDVIMECLKTFDQKP